MQSAHENGEGIIVSLAAELRLLVSEAKTLTRMRSLDLPKLDRTLKDAGLPETTLFGYCRRRSMGLTTRSIGPLRTICFRFRTPIEGGRNWRPAVSEQPIASISVMTRSGAGVRVGRAD